MFVKKRNGNIESVQFDKITQRIEKLVNENDKKYIDPVIVAQKVVGSIFSGITTEELDLESAKIAINLCTTHHLYSSLAGKILVSNLHKKTLNTFVEKEELIQQELGFLNEPWLQWIKDNRNELNSMINYENDYIYDYFGFKTLERSYLIKTKNGIIERPQDLLLRVASFINQGDLEMTKKTYDLMASGYYTHASPTLFNAGNNRSQLSSCFEGNTLVNTLKGLIPIKDVEIGDEVITHLGNVKKVIQKHKNKINGRKLYSVKFCRNMKNNKGFIVTEDHKLYTYDICKNTVSWIEVQNLTSNSYVMIPNNDKMKEQINCNYSNETIFQLENNIFVKFLSKEQVEIEDENVYTLGVEDDHSYSIEGIIAQNCFLLGTEDSLEGITKTWMDVAKISKWGGGIGLHVSNIRAKDSLIRGTNGPSSGIIPMLKVYNEIARYIDQCFVGSTKVFTEKGLVKIEDIVPKDKVYTIDGTLQEVDRIYCDKYNGEIINIKLPCNDKIVKVTKSHPFYTIKSSDKISFDLLKEKLDRQLVILDWVSVNEIEENDFICIPIPTYVNDNLNLDESDCYMYGLIIYNYIIDKDGMLGTYNEHEYIKQYLDHNNIEYIVKHNLILWNLTSKFKFTLSQIYNIDYNLLNLPQDKLKYILKGILDAKNKIIDDQYIIIESFVNDFLEALLLKLGILISNETTQILISKNKIISELYNTNESTNMHYLVHNNNIFVNLVKINYETIDTLVYDLEIKNNHNYLTEVGLVHNGGKRKGSIAIYLEPHHADVMAFLELRKNFGAETERARDLFLAVWVSDLFMKQVESDGDWYLMCPDKCPGLTDVYGEEYEKLYWSYVHENKFNKKMKAREIMKAILESQLETGTPYIGFKDNINNKSNQKNIGVIKSSNLCVHEDTLLLTKEGNIKIKTLKDKTVTIWNGFEWSDVDVKQTGSNQSLMKVHIIPYKNNNELPVRTLNCTHYHKFYVDNSDNIIDAHNLKLGYKLIGYNDSGINEISNYDYAKIVGLEDFGLTGDTYCLTEIKRHMAIFNGILTGQCIEIVEYSDANEYAVCNLASIAINKCVDEFTFNKEDIWVIYTKDNCKYCKWTKSLLLNKGITFEEIQNELPLNTTTYPQIFHNDKHIGGFDKLYEYTRGIFNYNKLYDIAYIATTNLNKIIDVNYYPVIEAKRSNLRHRPIGLGIQGLADALVMMKIQFDSEESVNFNSKMMETIYFAAVNASMDESRTRSNMLRELNISDCPEYYDESFTTNEIYHKLKLNRFELNNKILGSYSTFEGSPISEGKFQFDLWGIDRSTLMHNWDQLTKDVKKYGVRNSLLTALMPTASTSQILGNNECFEFFTNNIYSRRTLAGDFPLVNKYLINDLYDLGLWSNEMKQLILANNGSISNFNNIPDQIKSLYKTIWEIKQIWVLKNAIARGPFNDQTQSMNVFMQTPDYQKLYSSHFYAWKNGLKTGIYYLRTKPSKEAVKVTIDPNIDKKLKEITSDEHDVCESCSA